MGASSLAKRFSSTPLAGNSVTASPLLFFTTNGTHSFSGECSENDLHPTMPSMAQHTMHRPK